jgi:hypothetical protein
VITGGDVVVTVRTTTIYGVVVATAGDGVVVVTATVIGAEVVAVITAAVGVVGMIASVIDVVIVGAGAARWPVLDEDARLGGPYAWVAIPLWGDTVGVITIVTKAVTVRTANIYAVVVSTRVGSSTVVGVSTASIYGVVVRTCGVGVVAVITGAIYGVTVRTSVTSGTWVVTIGVGVCR